MKPQVKRRAHNWYALKPKSELASMSNKSKVIYQCNVNGVLGKAGKAVALCGKHKIKGGCGAHGNTKCVHKAATNESKVTA